MGAGGGEGEGESSDFKQLYALPISCSIYITLGNCFYILIILILKEKFTHKYLFVLNCVLILAKVFNPGKIYKGVHLYIINTTTDHP